MKALKFKFNIPEICIEKWKIKNETFNLERESTMFDSEAARDTIQTNKPRNTKTDSKNRGVTMVGSFKVVEDPNTVTNQIKRNNPVSEPKVTRNTLGEELQSGIEMQAQGIGQANSKFTNYSKGKLQIIKH